MKPGTEGPARPYADIVHIEAPWWWRPWAAATVLLVVVTGFLFAAGQWSGRQSDRHTIEDLSEQVIELRATQTETRGEQECRSQRSAAAINAQGDLMKNMSDLVGFLAARQPDQVPALMQERDRLSQNYAAAREELSVAVQACRAGAGG